MLLNGIFTYDTPSYHSKIDNEKEIQFPRLYPGSKASGLINFCFRDFYRWFFPVTYQGLSPLHLLPTGGNRQNIQCYTVTFCH